MGTVRRRGPWGELQVEKIVLYLFRWVKCLENNHLKTVFLIVPETENHAASSSLVSVGCLYPARTIHG